MKTDSALTDQERGLMEKGIADKSLHGTTVSISSPTKTQETSPRSGKKKPKPRKLPTLSAPRIYNKNERPDPSRVQVLLSKKILVVEEIRELRIEALFSPQQAAAIYQEIQRKTPYRNQRDNLSFEIITTKEGNVVLKSLGDVMCNLTSLARCLEAQGVAFDEEERRSSTGTLLSIAEQGEDWLEERRRSEGFGARTNIGTLIKIAEASGMDKTFLLWRSWNEGRDNKTHSYINISRDKWKSFGRDYLDQGYSLLLSIGGHIITVQEVAESGLVVDDPYGKVILWPSDEPTTWVPRTDVYGNPKIKNGKIVMREKHYWSYPPKSRNKIIKGNALWKGEDVLLPWYSVEKHMMHWLLAIGGKEMFSEDIPQETEKA